MPPDLYLPGPVEATPPRDDLPVARPANSVDSPSARPGPVPAAGAPLPPSVIKGWASSLAIHAFLLIAMASWYLASRESSGPKPFDTVLDGQALGDPNGVEGGITFRMGGVETPIAPPEAEAIVSPVAIAPTLHVPTPKAEGLRPRRPASRADKAKATDDGKVANPGQGGGVGGDGFGLARFGRPDGSLLKERVRGIEVKVGDPQFTLIWDTPADLDLHVIEPGGSEIFWVERNGRRGGELDVDNLTGYGPENIYWVEERDPSGQVKTRGQGPPGNYRWFVHYYGGAKVVGEDVPTRWKVRVKHNGAVTVYQGTLHKRQKSQIYTLVVGPHAPAPSRDGPEISVKAEADDSSMPRPKD